MKIKYPTNLTDNQYDTILQIINDNRKRRSSLKEVLYAIFYILKTGCQWRMLPRDVPKWERVYYYFHKWSCDGTIDEIHEVLRKRLRKKRGREESPSIGVIDYQGVKGTKVSGKYRGVDGGKKIKGRKRYIITDTQGLLLSLKVHATNEHDSRAALRVMERIKGRYERMKKIYADGGYRGKLIDNVKDMLNCDMEITLRTDKITAFKPLPKRWVVERSFAWLDDFRRLAKDYERKVICSEKYGIYSFLLLSGKDISTIIIYHF